MPTTGGYPSLVTSFEDQVGAVTWYPGGQWLAFNLAPGGGFNEHIYIVRPDGTDLRRLTDGGKANNFLDGWSPDGRFIASLPTAETLQPQIHTCSRSATVSCG